jgi:hypothetical protein
MAEIANRPWENELHMSFKAVRLDDRVCTEIIIENSSNKTQIIPKTYTKLIFLIERLNSQFIFSFLVITIYLFSILLFMN